MFIPVPLSLNICMTVLYTNKSGCRICTVLPIVKASFCVVITQRCFCCHTDSEVLSDEEQGPLRKQPRV